MFTKSRTGLNMIIALYKIYKIYAKSIQQNKVKCTKACGFLKHAKLLTVKEDLMEHGS